MPGRPPPHVLLTRFAADRWSSRIRDLVPDVTISSMDLSSPGGPATGGPDVAWTSFDVWGTRAGTAAWFARLVDTDTLRWCHTAAAGTNGAHYDALLERGVTLTNSHVTGAPIADFVLRAVLDVLQDAGAWRAAQADRVWRTHRFTEMSETTWLVVGLGSIGSEVVRRAAAFGARVIGCRRTPTGDEGCDLVVTPDRLPAVVGEADVVVLAAPSTAATIGLVDRALLERARKGAILVNVGRGDLVDEDAVVAALDQRRLRAAVLDVFRQEPLPADSPLWTHPGIIVTPHDSSSGMRREPRAIEVFVRNLARWRDGRDLTDVVRR